jgi:hypothetical protein
MQKINVLTLSIDKLLAEARDGDVKEVPPFHAETLHSSSFFEISTLVHSFLRFWITFEPVWHMTVSRVLTTGTGAEFLTLLFSDDCRGKRLN